MARLIILSCREKWCWNTASVMVDSQEPASERTENYSWILWRDGQSIPSSREAFSYMVGEGKPGAVHIPQVTRFVEARLNCPMVPSDMAYCWSYTICSLGLECRNLPAIPKNGKHAATHTHRRIHIYGYVPPTHSLAHSHIDSITCCTADADAALDQEGDSPKKSQGHAPGSQWESGAPAQLLLSLKALMCHGSLPSLIHSQ